MDEPPPDLRKTGRVTLLHDPTHHDFGSDNYAGAHPQVLAALAEANGGHVTAYGADPYTERLGQVLSGLLGRPAQVFPVLNGTGANVVALQSMLPRWGAVLCAETAHINCDENGAPERVGGLKLVAVPTPDGKLTPELVERHAGRVPDEHRAEPGVVSLTQSTELGTAYTIEELRAVVGTAHRLGLRVHLDGTRLANAAATLGTSLAAISGEAGVDVLHCSTRRFWEPEWDGDRRNLAGWVKSLGGLPTITVGSVGLDTDVMTVFMEGRDPRPRIEEAVEELEARMTAGGFDLVAVGRALIGDPDFVRKLEQRDYGAIRTFVRSDLGKLEWDTSIVEESHSPAA